MSAGLVEGGGTQADRTEYKTLLHRDPLYCQLAETHNTYGLREHTKSIFLFIIRKR